MKTTTDNFLKIGTAHFICQDYVISETEPFPYVILSDGCSSSAQSDMGARILTFTAKRYLLERCNNLDSIEYAEMGKWIIRQSYEVSCQLGLSTFALDATLIVAYGLRNHVCIHAYGDGVIVLSDCHNTRSVIEISFSGNAPYYLSYQLDANRDRIYRDQNLSKTVGEKMMNPDLPVFFEFPIDQYPVIMTASDGLGSFIDKSGAKPGLNTIVQEFTSFKNFKGEFLKRRVKRAIQNFEKSGFAHYDDLSLGAFLTLPETLQEDDGQ